jgi:uncharacterized protein YtpQ (UPF0354 family)
MRAIAFTLFVASGFPAGALGAGPESPTPEQLVGTWHSRTSQSEGTVTFRGDGTFEYRPLSEPRTIAGGWRLRGGAIVWSYVAGPGIQIDPRSEPDVNPIVEMSSDRFVLRETDGSLSVFTRQELLAPPEGGLPGVAQQLGAGAVVLVLAALAVLAWRALRPRSHTASSDGRIFPCLKETPWARLGPTVRRPLAEVEGAGWMPWVAFGYDQPDAFVFLQENDLEEMGRSASDIEAEALGNLRDREASWQMVEMRREGSGPVQFVRCTEDFFAAERILEPESVLEAQRRLGASALLAAVPRRGLLVLMDAAAGAEAIAGFVLMVAREHFEGQSAPISPLVFRMSEGRIVGALPSASRPATPA